MLQQVIGILFPVFALVLVGFSVGRWLKPDFRPINRINMDTFTPALVFSSLVSMPLDTEQVPSFPPHWLPFCCWFDYDSGV